MKTISRPNLKSAVSLTAAQMNNIHFGGNVTPLTPTRLKAIADKNQEGDDNAARPK